MPTNLTYTALIVPYTSVSSRKFQLTAEIILQAIGTGRLYEYWKCSVST